MADSNSFAITISALSTPTWAVGQAVNEWRQISGSSMAASPPSIDPGRDSGPVSDIVNAWNGFSIDTRSGRVWAPANGGHDNNHENGVRYLPLMSNTPTWIEVLPSSAAAAFTIPNDAARYTDGRPCSIHSYYVQQFIEARNRAMRFGTPAGASIGNSFVNVEGFDCTVAIGVNGWDAVNTWAPLPTCEPGYATCKNPVTEDVFVFISNASVRKWTQSTNTWSQVNTVFPAIGGNESATAYDTARDRIVLLRGSTDSSSVGGAYCSTFDPATGTWTSRTLTGSAAATVMASRKGMGMVYVPALDSYVVRLLAAGGTVYVINASTFAVTTPTTTGGGSLPTAFDIGGTENVYGKFLYFPTLGGVVYIPTYAANAWFLRLH
jgi:hypothetical protein